jgi:peptidoglycan hydrolase-like protein with peptidoglycan-binding domain
MIPSKACGVTERSSGWRIPAVLMGAAALAFAAAEPAMAQKKAKKAEAADELADIAADQPMTIVVSLDQQKVDIYRGQVLLASSAVSTGRRGYSTPAGVFSILEKRRHHRSNIYNNAPMPFMQRLTWSGIALHEGVVPGYPASHGCIRLTSGFAPKLFRMTDRGVNVLVSHDRAAPEPIQHANLFQLPKPAEAAQEDGNRGDVLRSGAKSPVILAKAEGETLPAEHAVAPGVSDGQAQIPGEGAGQATLVPGNAEKETAETAPGATEVELAALETDETREAKPPLAEEDGLTQGEAGAEIPEMAEEDAEERSTEPLRILVTKLSQREHIRNLQHELADLGFIESMNFDGHMGRITAGGIRDFQKAYGLPQTGAFSHELLRKVYKASGKGEPPAAHLYVRQAFDRVFDAPVGLRDADETLGTYSFTAQAFKPGAEKVEWQVVNVHQPAGSTPAKALERVEIPDDVRARIEEILTPGSVLILADVSINTPLLPKGGDYVVHAQDQRVAAVAEPAPQARPQQRRAQRPQRVQPPRYTDPRRYPYQQRGYYQPRGPFGFW